MCHSNRTTKTTASAVGDFRKQRQCLAISGSFLLLALYATSLPTQAVARPPDEPLYSELAGADEYADVDNVEWHHVKIVDGLMQEDHPIIMYKEDFVNEDFNPGKNRTAAAHQHRNRSRHNRKQNAGKRLSEKEQYRALKPETMLFDVLPQRPLLADDDSLPNDSKFDASKIRVDVISLANDNYNGNVGAHMEEEADKQQLLNKRPKKYHSRARRDTQAERRKRNPYIRPQARSDNNLVFSLLTPAGAQAAETHKYSVAGRKHNGIDGTVPMDFDSRFGDVTETEKVVWGGIPRRPAVVTRRPPSLFHNSNPEDANYDFITRRTPVPSQNSIDTDASILQVPIGTRTPAAQLPPPTTRPAARPSAAANVGISNCVWAIVNCCSTRDINIRYNCFEMNQCSGAFWDLNPCADNVRDNAVDFVSNFYE